VFKRVRPRLRCLHAPIPPALLLLELGLTLTDVVQRELGLLGLLVLHPDLADLDLAKVGPFRLVFPEGGVVRAFLGAAERDVTNEGEVRGVVKEYERPRTRAERRDKVCGALLY